jgi:transcriptional regulator with GAF, ATPase, and Fis domain
VKLLRVLQDGELTRVGGNEVIKTDVRVLAASNVDLKRAVELGMFRQDLFYRLSVFPIKLPPLRERPQDIHPLVIHFIEHYKQKTGRFISVISGISKDALQALITYDWAGNVRELENAIERAVIIASGRQIELEDLPDAISKIALEERDRIKVERAKAASEGRTTTFQITVPYGGDRTPGHRGDTRLHCRRQVARRPRPRHRPQNPLPEARTIQRWPERLGNRNTDLL